MCHYSKEHASSWVCNTCCIYALLILSALNKLLLRLVCPSMKQSNIKWQEQALQTETVKRYVQLNCATWYVQVISRNCSNYVNVHGTLFKRMWMCNVNCSISTADCSRCVQSSEPCCVQKAAISCKCRLLPANIFLSSNLSAYLEFSSLLELFNIFKYFPTSSYPQNLRLTSDFLLKHSLFQDPFIITSA